MRQYWQKNGSVLHEREILESSVVKSTQFGQDADDINSQHVHGAQLPTELRDDCLYIAIGALNFLISAIARCRLVPTSIPP